MNLCEPELDFFNKYNKLHAVHRVRPDDGHLPAQVPVCRGESAAGSWGDRDSRWRAGPAEGWQSTSSPQGSLRATDQTGSSGTCGGLNNGTKNQSPRRMSILKKYKNTTDTLNSSEQCLAGGDEGLCIAE